MFSVKTFFFDRFYQKNHRFFKFIQILYAQEMKSVLFHSIPSVREIRKTWWRALNFTWNVQPGFFCADDAACKNCALNFFCSARTQLLIYSRQLTRAALLS